MTHVLEIDRSGNAAGAAAGAGAPAGRTQVVQLDRHRPSTPARLQAAAPSASVGIEVDAGAPVADAGRPAAGTDATAGSVDDGIDAQAHAHTRVHAEAGVAAEADTHAEADEERLQAVGELLDADFVTTMAASGCTHSFAANTVLMHEGDRGDSIFIIIRGRVKLYSEAQGREVVHGLLGAREYFGELSLDGGVRPTSVMTLAATDCVVVQGWQMRQFLADHPKFAMQLMMKLIGLVRQSTAHVTSLATVGVYGRIRALLTSAAVPDGDQWRVAEPMTQVQIAHRVGCSREMVCRVMNELRRGGYVARDGKSLRLMRPLPRRW